MLVKENELVELLQWYSRKDTRLDITFGVYGQSLRRLKWTLVVTRQSNDKRTVLKKLKEKNFLHCLKLGWRTYILCQFHGRTNRVYWPLKGLEGSWGSSSVVSQVVVRWSIRVEFVVRFENYWRLLCFIVLVSVFYYYYLNSSVGLVRLYPFTSFPPLGAPKDGMSEVLS